MRNCIMAAVAAACLGGVAEAQWDVDSWVDQFTDQEGVRATQEENGTVIELGCENGEFVLDFRGADDYRFASARVDVRLDDGDIMKYWFTSTNGDRTLTVRGGEVHGLVEKIFAHKLLRVRTSWWLRKSEPLDFDARFDTDGLRDAFAMTPCLAQRARTAAVAFNRDGAFPEADSERVVAGFGTGVDEAATGGRAVRDFQEAQSEIVAGGDCQVIAVSEPGGCVVVGRGAYTEPGARVRMNGYYTARDTDCNAAVMRVQAACAAAMEALSANGSADDTSCYTVLAMRGDMDRPRPWPVP